VFHGLTAIIPTQLITDRKEGGKARVWIGHWTARSLA
jgi:hypothetical protein